MRGAWWWIDRWRKSNEFNDLTAEQQGLYRNLLDELWLREDHAIPDDQRILARVSGDHEAWERSGPRVLECMTKTKAGWTHPTAVEVIEQSKRRAENQRRYRQRRDNKTDNEPDSPSPSPSPDPEEDIGPTDLTPSRGAEVELADIWKSKLPDHAQVRQPLSSGVRKALKAALARESLSYWRDLFQSMLTMPHLMGQNDRGWKPSLMWAVGPTNSAKIESGSYKQSTPEANPEGKFPW